MEIRNYNLNNGEILYTYVRLGKKDYYFHNKTIKVVKNVFFCLTLATLFTII